MSLELLKPPFKYGGGFKWDWTTYHIRAYINGEETAILKLMPIADVRYYRKMMGIEGYEKFLKALSEFTVNALNDKWKRDFGKKKYRCKNCRDVKCMLKEAHKDLVDYEPLRWGFSNMNDEIHCPVCGHLWFVYEDGFDWEKWRFCPTCGQRLLPPELLTEVENGKVN